MAGEYIFTMRDLRKVVPPSREILKGIHLSFFPGAKIGVLGANGAGQSRCSASWRAWTRISWATRVRSRARGSASCRRSPSSTPTKDVRGNVMEGVREQQALLDQFNEISARFAEPMDDDEMARLLEKQGNLQERIDALGLWELDHKIDLAMDALRLPPGDADVGQISGGERRRVALCRLLLEEPDMLLLDEPTNHLDAESVWWLERYLAEFKGTVVAVTHDRYFLDNVAGLDPRAGSGRGHPVGGQLLLLARAEGAAAGPGGEAGLGPAEDAAARARVGAHVPARAAGQEQGAHHPLRGAARGGRAADRGQRRDPDPGARAAGRRGRGRRATCPRASATGCCSRTSTSRCRAAASSGVIGPNGAGKTTLFRMITGQESADAGTLTVGSTVQMAYVDQSRDALDADKTVYQEISGGQDQLQFGRRSVNARAYAAGFNFRGADQQKKVGTLSGGERNRLHLAKLLKSGGNLLLLDEPTNDLDVDTLRALEEALLGFAGCAVVISHDRWFLDRIATHILAFEGNSEVVWFEGNYAEYAADLKRRKGVDANQPHRIRYKKLVH